VNGKRRDFVELPERVGGFTGGTGVTFLKLQKGGGMRNVGGEQRRTKFLPGDAGFQEASETASRPKISTVESCDEKTRCVPYVSPFCWGSNIQIKTPLKQGKENKNH